MLINRYLLGIAAAIVACFGMTTLAIGQNNDDATESIRIQTLNTRSISMGNATIADFYGADGFGINPALLGLYQEAIISSSIIQNWDVNQIQATLTLPRIALGASTFGVQLGIVQDSFPGISIGTEPEFNPNYDAYYAALGYAVKLHPHLSFGALQYVTFAEYQNNRAMAYAADFGLVYAPDGFVSYAITFRGIGEQIGLQQQNNGSEFFRETMPQVLEIGASLRYPDYRDYHIFSFSLSNEKQFGEDGMRYKGGLEYFATKVIALRFGLLFQTNERVLLPRYGLGLNLSFVRLDYAMSPNENDHHPFHQFGLSITF